MSKRYRLFLLVLSSILLIIIGLLIERNLMFLIESFWFSSGVLMMIMLSLIDQPYFSKDSNIFVNSVTASISLLLVELNERDFMFYIFVCIIVYLLFSSYVLIWIRKSPLYEENKVVQFVSRINRNIGRPETLFSALFIWGAINQYKLNSLEFNMLFLYWLLFSILNIPEIAKTIDSIFAKRELE